MKAKILYSLLFAIAMTLVATADYSGNKKVSTDKTTIISLNTTKTPHLTQAAFTPQYIPDSTSLVLR